MNGFSARPRRSDDDGEKTRRLIAEVDRLASRLARAVRDGREAFLTAESDSRDVAALALINLADLVHRDLPHEVVATLPSSDVAGLRATRNIAAHNYGALDSDRLWATVTGHAPRLLATIRSALMRE
ncbi:HepT-like ribonuclease domain-containing protein [Rathayibacter tanaceti]|uniref:DUF86 domain-containing protein n=2 Tax=Rathayibacter tanaceti TaxID=1671680 RepID=A0A166HIX0_9MICO|nr:HepT-like ribonuclease domain-containing protein [Rathayibacter tanaceti]KZX20675.1 hypothetical protein ACH61_02210 [Rathayibacter tanaceti]QHC54842.1 DUF86 domain-containing protein [Rathayibacter tanaceti]TCO38376.1 uncharacterized protein DUF86 [Rathayibacter tanaceti]